MTEETGSVTTRGTRRRTTMVMIAVCLIGVVVIAGFAVWYFESLGPTESSDVSLMLLQDDVSELTFMISDPSPDNVVSWRDVVIKLVATPTDRGPSYTYAYWVWRPSEELLTSPHGESITQSMNSSYGHSSNMINCNLRDITGNGVMNDGDFFTLIIVGDEVDLVGVPCELTVTWLLAQGPMGSLEFTPFEDRTSNSPMIAGLFASFAVAAIVFVALLLLRRKNRKEKPDAQSQEPRNAD